MIAKIDEPLLSLMTTQYSEEDFFVREEEVKAESIKGDWRLQELNGCSIFETQVNQKKNSELRVHYKEEAVKLHFQIMGQNTYANKEDDSGSRTVVQGYYNIFQVNKGTTRYKLQGALVHSFEIILDKTFFLSVTQGNYKVDSFLENKTNDRHRQYWKQNQPLTDTLCALINEVKTCSLKGCLRKTYLEAKIIEIMETLFIKKPKCISLGVIPARTPKIEDSLMERVQTFLEENMSKRITIPELAQFAGINTSKLKHDFKQAYGTTIFKHLTSLRMKKAHRILAKNESTVADVSQKVGYKNPQHFTVAFKKYYGFLPRELNQPTVIDGG